ncbi:MAG: CinA family protein [Arcanobacterium sp.]
MSKLATSIIELGTELGVSLAVAESLTGGRLADALVSVPGASNVFRGGAVTYAVDTKAGVLGVDAQRLTERGPVDPLVAQQMARGVAQLYDADIAVSTTGVAGPGAADGFAAGTVWIGWFNRFGSVGARLFRFDGDRETVRSATVEKSLERLFVEISRISGESR